MSLLARSTPWLIALAALAPAAADDPARPAANPGRPPYPYARKAATSPAPAPARVDPVVRRAQTPPVPLPEVPVPVPSATINAPAGAQGAASPWASRPRFTGRSPATRTSSPCGRGPRRPPRPSRSPAGSRPR